MFLARNGVVSGAGTINNPYIIEGWHIDGTNRGFCIYIGNTTNFFIIRDCYCFNANGNFNYPWTPNAGIVFYDVTNGKISKWDWNVGDPYHTGNAFIRFKRTYTVENGMYGILLVISNLNTIEETIIHSNNVYGIRLEDSHENYIYHNWIWNHEFGIELDMSTYNEIIDNYIWNNNVGIVLINNSNNNLFNYNDIFNNGTWGMDIQGCTGNQIYYNNFINNGNSPQAQDTGANSWDDGNPAGPLGNFWSDYVPPPPYVIAGGVGNVDNGPAPAPFP